MNKLMKVTLIILVIMNYSSAIYADTDRAELTKNPFKKPVVESTGRKNESSKLEKSPTLSEDSLRATLSSDERAIANVDGLMIFVGDMVKGYELISVGEGMATFRKDGKKITLGVSEKHKQLSNE